MTPLSSLPQPPDSEALARVFREESGRAMASLIRILGDIDLAEDAVQDAFVSAMETWPAQGLPDSPGAWIVRVGRHRAIDRLRRESLGRALLADQMELQTEAEPKLPWDDHPLADDTLRLIFTCCHPALHQEAQVALTLRLLGGLDTNAVAQAFLVSEETMSQRLVRAKRKIKASSLPYRVPSASELIERLPPVLAVLYLIYNAGAGQLPQDATDDLCLEGLRLTRLAHSVLPQEPEVSGLLALLLLNQSRRSARYSPHGELVRLMEQARDRWDPTLIAEGQGLVRHCLQRGQPGPYQLQAAIQAVHADAKTASDTDWAQIVALYDHLLKVHPSAVVALNRAIAFAEVAGAAPALAIVDDLELEDYYLLHATRGNLLLRLMREPEAAAAYRRAAELAPSEAERAFNLQEAQRCSGCARGDADTAE